MKQVMNYNKDNGLLNMIRRTDPMIVKSWVNPLNWIRNAETIIGSYHAGKGTAYKINIYGSKQLEPLFPWIK